MRLDDDDDEAERKRLDGVIAGAERRIAATLAGQLTRLTDGSPAAVAGAMQNFEHGEELRLALFEELVLGMDAGAGVAAETLSRIGAGFDLNLVHEQAQQWARGYSYDLVRGINNTTRQILQTAVGDWIGQSRPLSDLVAAVQPAFGANRAKVIAYTESTRAFSEGSILSFEQSGVVELFEWETVRDDRTCPICLPLHGQQFPLRGDRRPPAHIGCRCHVKPVVVEEYRRQLEKKPRKPERPPAPEAIAAPAWAAIDAPISGYFSAPAYGQVAPEEAALRQRMYETRTQIKDAESRLDDLFRAHRQAKERGASAEELNAIKERVNLVKGEQAGYEAALKAHRAEATQRAETARRRVEEAHAEYGSGVDAPAGASRAEQQMALLNRKWKIEADIRTSTGDRRRALEDELSSVDVLLRKTCSAQEVDTQEALQRQRRWYDAIRRPLLVSDPGVVTADADVAHDTWRTGLTAFNQMVDRSVLGERKIRFNELPAMGRAYQQNGQIFVRPNEPVAIVAHELGHAIEHLRPDIAERVQAFYRERTAGDSLEKMSTLTGNASFGDDERTRRDKWLDLYMGKDYNGQASEIVSMGIQMFIEAPHKLAKDAEYFGFIYTLLRDLQ